MLKNRKKKGFTLIELIVVIAILGILAAIAIPKFTGTQQRARLRAHNSNVRILQSAAQTYIAEKGTPAANMNATDTATALAPYVETWPTPPDGTGNSTVDAATAYTVTISSAGEVVVSPAAVSD